MNRRFPLRLRPPVPPPQGRYLPRLVSYRFPYMVGKDTLNDFYAWLKTELSYLSSDEFKKAVETPLIRALLTLGLLEDKMVDVRLAGSTIPMPVCCLAARVRGRLFDAYGGMATAIHNALHEMVSAGYFEWFTLDSVPAEQCVTLTLCRKPRVFYPVLKRSCRGP